MQPKPRIKPKAATREDKKNAAEPTPLRSPQIERISCKNEINKLARKRRAKIDFSSHTPKRPVLASDVNQNDDKSKVSISKMLEWIEKYHPGKPHFTIAETAEITGMSEDFIRDHIAGGKITALKMGTKKRITLHELARILEQGTN